MRRQLSSPPVHSSLRNSGLLHCLQSWRSDAQCQDLSQEFCNEHSRPRSCRSQPSSASPSQLSRASWLLLVPATRSKSSLGVATSCARSLAGLSSNMERPGCVDQTHRLCCSLISHAGFRSALSNPSRPGGGVLCERSGTWRGPGLADGAHHVKLDLSSF